MNSKVKALAVSYVLETTKTRNYRKHIANNMMNLIVNDILTTMANWSGPGVSEDTDDSEELAELVLDTNPTQSGEGGRGK